MRAGLVCCVLGPSALNAFGNAHRKPASHLQSSASPQFPCPTSGACLSQEATPVPSSPPRPPPAPAACACAAGTAARPLLPGSARAPQRPTRRWGRSSRPAVVGRVMAVVQGQMVTRTPRVHASHGILVRRGPRRGRGCTPTGRPGGRQAEEHRAAQTRAGGKGDPRAHRKVCVGGPQLGHKAALVARPGLQQHRVGGKRAVHHLALVEVCPAIDTGGRRSRMSRARSRQGSLGLSCVQKPPVQGSASPGAQHTSTAHASPPFAFPPLTPILLSTHMASATSLTVSTTASTRCGLLGSAAAAAAAAAARASEEVGAAGMASSMVGIAV